MSETSTVTAGAAKDPVKGRQSRALRWCPGHLTRFRMILNRNDAIKRGAHASGVSFAASRRKLCQTAFLHQTVKRRMLTLFWAGTARCAVRVRAKPRTQRTWLDFTFARGVPSPLRFAGRRGQRSALSLPQRRRRGLRNCGVRRHVAAFPAATCRVEPKRGHVRALQSSLAAAYPDVAPTELNHCWEIVPQIFCA